MAVSMFAVILIPFVFALLVFLLIKSPKAGAVFAGVLVCLVLAGLFGGRFLASGAGGGIALMPLIVIVLPFVFVLLILLLAKAPKVGIGVLVALVALAVAGIFVAVPVSHRRVAYVEESPGVDTAVPRGSAEPGGAAPIWSEGVEKEFEADVGAAPIWSEGVEKEFEADVYPSKLSAVRAAGAQLGKSIPGLARDPNSSPRMVIFQQTLEYRLIAELRDALREALPDVPCDIEAESRAVTGDEIGVALYFGEHDTRPAPWAESPEATVASGQIDINLSGHRGKVHIPVRFTEKPWVEDFATFANMRPKRQFSVGSSSTACLSESEAREQAMHDAAGQVQRRIGRQWKVPGVGELAISPQDLREGGFIVDTFLQSFYGSAGRIWRQAVLMDASPQKLSWLEARMNRAARAERTSWARMGFSVIGVLVLIGSIYFFLNMATRGYYEWSLRIAGAVLAIVAVVSVLMMVQ